MSHHGMRDHEEAQEAGQVAEEKTNRPIDLDTRAIELTKQVNFLDTQIADLQKTRADVQKELRAIKGKILTRELNKAAKA